MRGPLRTALVLGFLIGASPLCAQDEEDEPHAGLFDGNPFPQIEHLLHQAQKTKCELTPASLGRLPATRDLLAMAVLQPASAAQLSNHLISSRAYRAAVYGLFLALQFDAQPPMHRLLNAFKEWPDSLMAHLVTLFWQSADAEGDYHYHLLARADPNLNAQARTLFFHRLPLDQPLLERILAGLGRDVSPVAAKHLALLASRMNADALSWVAPRWATLAPPVRQVLAAGLSRIPRDDPRHVAVAGLLGRRDATSPTGPGAGDARAPAKSPARPGPSAARKPPALPGPSDHVFWILAVGGGILAILAIRSACRERTALLLALVLGLAGRAAPAAAQWDEWREPPHKELEALLEQSNLLPRDASPLALSRLAATPPLIALAVLEDRVPMFLAMQINRVFLYGNPRLLGTFIALHLEVLPTLDRLAHVARGLLHDTEGHLALQLYMRLAPDPTPAHREMWKRRGMEAEPERRALELLRLRMPLDAEILAEIDRRSRGFAWTPAQVERLGKMWHRLDDSGGAYLTKHRTSLSGLLSRLIELRGITAPAKPAGR